MAIRRFDNTAAGKAAAEAVPQPRYIMEGPRITVFTGADIPPAGAVTDPSSIVLTTRQLIQGANAIARARAQAIESYIRGVVGLDAKDPADQIAPTGNYAQNMFWKYHNATIRRTDPEINAMRVALGWNAALMDSIFVAGSGMDP